MPPSIRSFQRQHDTQDSERSDGKKLTAVAQWQRERAHLYTGDHSSATTHHATRIFPALNTSRGVASPSRQRKIPHLLSRLADKFRGRGPSGAATSYGGASVDRRAVEDTSTSSPSVSDPPGDASIQESPQSCEPRNYSRPFAHIDLETELERWLPRGVAHLAAGGASHTLYVRQMRWSLHGSVWRGEWRWIPQSTLTPSDLSRQADGRAESGHHIPPEIFLHIASLEVDGGTRSRGLANMALTCHAWFAICAPLLYSSAHVTNARLDAFTRCIRVAHSRFRDHATAVTLHGPRSWSVYPRLTELLPNLSHLRLVEPEGSHAPSYHPSLLHILATSAQSFEQLRTLQLTGCRFVESRDLVILLTSFPGLITADVRRCTYNEPSLDALARRSDTLRQVTFTECGASWPFTLLWTRPTASPTVDFYGLDPNEVEMAVAPVLRLLRLNGTDRRFDLRVDETCYARTWIVWMRTADLHVEFHASRFPLVDLPTQDDQWGPAHIRHIVFRCSSSTSFHSSLDDHFVEDGVRKMDPHLARLPHLKTVKFESQRSRSESDVLVNQLTMIVPKVRRSTCRQAREYAHKMKQNTDAECRPRATLRSIPVSPLWYLDELVDESAQWIIPEYSSQKARDISGGDVSPTSPVEIQLHDSASTSSVEIVSPKGLSGPLTTDA